MSPSLYGRRRPVTRSSVASPHRRLDGVFRWLVSALPESSLSFFTPCGKQTPPSVGAQLTPDRELAAQTASNGASPPERMARIRLSECRSLLKQ